jgi:uncharacterized protein (TIGR03067 family)
MSTTFNKNRPAMSALVAAGVAAALLGACTTVPPAPERAPVASGATTGGAAGATAGVATTKPAMIRFDMSGTWMPRQSEMSGKALALPTGFVLQVKGDRYGAGIAPNFNDAGRIETVSQDANGVQHLNIMSEMGQNKGRTIPAIARMNGNELEVCYDMEFKARPTEFVSREGTRHFRVVYVRQ